MCFQMLCRPLCSVRPSLLRRRRASLWNPCPSRVRTRRRHHAPDVQMKRSGREVRILFLRIDSMSLTFDSPANSEKKRGKRKRKLIVDQNKELSDAYIKEQILDFSDLVGSMDLAPPTLQLMLWKENGGAHRLFARPCSSFIAPQIFEVKERGRCPRTGVPPPLQPSLSCEALLHFWESRRRPSGSGRAAAGPAGR